MSEPQIAEFFLGGVTFFFCGYQAGKLSSWNPAYKLGHEHGYAIGKLDGMIEQMKRIKI